MFLSKVRLQAKQSAVRPGTRELECLVTCSSEALLRFYSTISSTTCSNFDTNQEQSEGTQSRSRQTCDSMIRVANLSVVASSAFLQGLGHSKSRQDVRFILESEKSLLSETSRVMQDSQSRPSALQMAAKIGFRGAGIAASALPPFVRNSVLAGLNEAVEDSCIDQLRDLRAKGLSGSNPELRSLMMRIRDHSERVPEGAPKVPDVMSLPEITRLDPDQALAFIVKQGTSAILQISKKI